MDYYCDVCDTFFKPKSRNKHFKSNTHEDFDICKNLEITIGNPDINNIDEVFYAHIIQHNKQYDHFLIKCHFRITFIDSQYSTWIKSNVFNNETMIVWKKFLKNVIDDFKKDGHNFNHTEKMNITTKSIRTDVSYDFYIKHNMHAIEWKLIAMINKKKFDE